MKIRKTISKCIIGFGLWLSLLFIWGFENGEIEFWTSFFGEVSCGLISCLGIVWYNALKNKEVD